MDQQFDRAIPEYSTRLGAIRPDQFQAALARFDLGDFVAAERVSQGLFGQNVFVTSTQGQYVLRGCPHYDWQFPKERLGAALLAEHTRAPVAHPYLLDESADVFGWPNMLMPRLSGISANSETLSASDKVEVARALAEALADLHALTSPSPGEYDLVSNAIKPFAGSFTEWLAADVRNWLTRARENGDATTAADCSWVDEVIESALPALNESFQPCFVMNDYNPGNVVVQQTDGVWRVSGVFDLMEYYFGDGKADLVRLLSIYRDKQDGPLAEQFARAYLARRPPRPGFAERSAIYMLRDRLIIWEYGTRQGQGWFPAGLSLRQYAAPYLEMARTLARMLG